MRHRTPLLTFPFLVVAITLMALATPAWGCIGAQTGEAETVAPTPPAAPAIHLQAATFAPAAGEQPALPEGLADEGPSLSAAGAATQALVQFEGPILPAWRAALEATGVQVAGYVPDFAYLVDLNGASMEAVRAVEGVIWAGPYLPGYRVSPDALEAGDDLLRVELEGESAALLASLPGLGVRLVSQEGNTLAVRADEAALAALSAGVLGGAHARPAQRAQRRGHRAGAGRCRLVPGLPGDRPDRQHRRYRAGFGQGPAPGARGHAS